MTPPTDDDLSRLLAFYAVHHEQNPHLLHSEIFGGLTKLGAVEPIMETYFDDDGESCHLELTGYRLTPLGRRTVDAGLAAMRAELAPRVERPEPDPRCAICHGRGDYYDGNRGLSLLSPETWPPCPLCL